MSPLGQLLLAFARVLRVVAVVLVGGVAALQAQTESALSVAAEGTPPWYREAMGVIMRSSAQAQKTAEEHLASARASGDRTEEAYALLLLGAARGRLSDLPAMLGHTRAGLDLAERLGSPPLLLTALTVRAAAFHAAGDLAAGIELFLQALPLAERLGLRSTLRETLNGLARAYAELGDKDRALDFAQQAFAAAEQSENSASIATSATILANAHRVRGEFAESRRFLNRALELQRAAGRTTELTDNEESLAMLDFRDGRLTEALAILERVDARRRTLRGRAKLTQTLLNRAQVLLALDRRDEALACAEEARSYADTINSPGVTAPVYDRLATIHEARGDFAASLAAYKRATAAEQILRGESARQKTAELQARYDVARKDEELARLARVNEVKAAEERLRSAQLAATAADLRASEAELARTRAQRLALGSGVVAVALLLGALVVVQRSRLRAERLALEETRRAQLLAEDAGVLKARLLAIASHDLKGPLRSMLRSADSLEQKSADPTAVLGAAQLVRGHAHQMSDLVRDLLDLSAIEGGDLTLQKSPLDLARLTAEVVGRHTARAAEKLQTLSFPAPATALPFVGDAARLAQALDNLVDNAVKYTPAGGTITVTAALRGAHLCVAVADQGPGLGADELGRLFQPFQRLSAQPTGGESSTGLGLHIARDFIARHGGTIEVDTAPGHGTTFTVLLPVAPS